MLILYAHFVCIIILINSAYYGSVLVLPIAKSEVSPSTHCDNEYKKGGREEL